MVTLEQYHEILEDRPRKFSAEEVNYSKAKSDLINCSHCIHFYIRFVDGPFATCEIFRSAQTDKVGVFPHYKCIFQTPAGQSFPLYPKDSHVDESSDEPADD